MNKCDPGFTQSVQRVCFGSFRPVGNAAKRDDPMYFKRVGYGVAEQVCRSDRERLYRTAKPLYDGRDAARKQKIRHFEKLRQADC